jgi:hypothetical protein
MAKVDRLTLSNFNNFLNERSPKTKVGDWRNPARTWLNNLGIAAPIEAVLENKRVPRWFHNYVYEVRNRPAETVSVNTARRVIQNYI